jgi:hypothetical protein
MSTTRTLKRNLALRKHILSGGTPKEFAYNHGISIALVGKALASVCLRKYFLTKCEHERIMLQRKHDGL